MSKASRTFLLYMFDITAIVLGWIQLDYPWHSLVCSVAPDESQLPFMLSSWCSVQPVNTFFFDLPIYLPIYSQNISKYFADDSHARFQDRSHTNKFLEILNKQDPAIKYTVEFEDHKHSPNFLDIIIANNTTNRKYVIQGRNSVFSKRVCWEWT